ncbi:MAG: hypothetical protein JWN98_558, partial [Abditibacteriota bacterium]|nr:hypothetical protein [Abditibacteriota bacterium]
LQDQAQPSLKPKRIALGTPAGASAAGGAQSTLAPTEGIVISASMQLRTDAQMGFDPAAVQALKKAGYIPIARLSNALNLDLPRVRRLLDEAKATGARIVIFSEDEVLGYDTLIGEVAKEMRDRGLIFGNIEFTKQRGWPDFTARTEGNVVRVHNVGGDEAAKAKTHLLVDRYARSIKERNVRVAYIRLIRQFKGEPPPKPPGFMARLKQSVFRQPPAAQKTALQQNLDFVADVAKEVRAAPVPFLRAPLQTGSASTFGEYPVEQLSARWGDFGGKVLRYLSLFCAGLGALGAFLLMANLFFDLSEAMRKLLLLAGLLAVAVLSLSAGIGAKLIGLVAGCMVTPVAMLWGGLPFLWEKLNDEPIPTSHSGSIERDDSPAQAFKTGFRILVQTTLLTFLGPLLVVAAYNHWKFLSHSDEFIGEKATLTLPLLIVAIAFGGLVFPHRVIQYGANEARRRALERARSVLEQPFTTRVALAGLGLAIMGYFFIARTGNDSGMEISTFEWNFRSLMEQVFLTRPRTKEMFLGMPAMIFAAYFVLRRQPALALGAVVAATIGQADILNTFCHFWTPLFYSLLRTVHAVWIGALLGGLGVWLWGKIERALFGRMRSVSLRPGGSSSGTSPSSRRDTVIDGSTGAAFGQSTLSNGETPLAPKTTPMRRS